MMASDHLNRPIKPPNQLPDFPDAYFSQFSSHRLLNSSSAPFVCCRFSPQTSHEGFLAVGDEVGVVMVGNVDQMKAHDSWSNFYEKAFRIDAGCVLDIDFMPNQTAHLISISGHSTVGLWDVEKGIAILQFVGHEGSVRALSVCNDSPDVFATGARDGTICIWDQREKTKSGMTVAPTSVISLAHVSRACSGGLRSSASKRRSTSLRGNPEPKGITSLTFLDSNTLISASTSTQTGILFRDLRYWGNNVPVRTLEYPSSMAKRDFGVASICLNHYRSSLFVATTDSFVWEYSVNSTKNTPVDVLRGVKRSSVCAFDMKLCASPVSDHLSYGSGEQYALLWDLQEKKYRNNSRNVNTSISTDYYPYPKFVLGGHTSEVSVAQFSCGSRYIASIDDSICRLWQFDRSLVEKRSKSLMKTNGFEQIEYYSLPNSQGTASQMEKLCVTPVDSPSAKRKAPIKSPFTSPFKSAPNSGRYLNAERSPVKKISKLSSSPLSPLPNICNVELSAKHARSSRRLDFSPENIFAFENESVDDSLASVESPKCAFYYKYPTENLPNWVEERHKTKTEQQRKHPSPPITISVTPKRMCSNIMQFFSPPSPGIANCSRMISHAEREIQRSPRKLLLKQRLKESAERAQKVARQVTPRRSKATTRRISSTGARGAKSSHRIITDPKTPTSAPPITGQVLTDKILSSSSSPPTTTTTTNSAPRVGRTIKDFFMAKRNLNTSS